jgi:hypothetical protein|tara:strand:- start:2153 stop:2548 length:396 start_codon:yes stop_codon:yes gene_type:complete
MPVYVQQKVLTEDVINNSNVVFAYLENDKKSGGTALATFLRDSDQGIGIRLKKSHGDQIGCYWDDKEFRYNTDKMKEDIGSLEELLKNERTVVFAKGDFDSYNEQRFLEVSPRSYKYFKNRITKLLRIYRP